MTLFHEDASVGDVAEALASVGLRPVLLSGIRADGSCSCGQVACPAPGAHEALFVAEGAGSQTARIVKQLRRNPAAYNLGVSCMTYRGEPSSIVAVYVDHERHPEALDSFRELSGAPPLALGLAFRQGAREVRFFKLPGRYGVRLPRALSVGCLLECRSAVIRVPPSRPPRGQALTKAFPARKLKGPTAFADLHFLPILGGPSPGASLSWISTEPPTEIDLDSLWLTRWVMQGKEFPAPAPDPSAEEAKPPVKAGRPVLDWSVRKR